MQKVKIILLGIGAAVIYGVIHDEVTVRLSKPYFALAHPPLFRTDSPTLLGLYWGIAATIGVGFLLGVLLAEVSQSQGLPPVPVSRLYRPIAVLLCVTAASAVTAGRVGFELSRRSVLALPDVWFVFLSRAEQDRFMAAWFAHGASYLIGVAGGALLIFQIWRRRNRPRVLSLLPRSRSAIVRTVALMALLAIIVWLRWFRSPS
jgi:hypothetical protein